MRTLWSRRDIVLSTVVSLTVVQYVFMGGWSWMYTAGALTTSAVVWVFFSAEEA